MNDDATLTAMGAELERQGREAAERHRWLEAEVPRLMAENAYFREALERIGASMAAAAGMAEKLEVENDRLRERVKNRFDDLTGMTFGRLTVVGRAENSRRRDARWNCLCECGVTFDTVGYSLKRGDTKSCGCLRREIVHGHARKGRETKSFKTWKGMIVRCRPEHRRHADYYDRGITVCDRWLNFEAFLEDMGEPPTPKHDLDRIDNDLGYFPINCHWGTRRDQENNKRTSRRITLGSRTMTVAQWCVCLRLSPRVVRDRLRRGWLVDEALTRPIGDGSRKRRAVTKPLSKAA